MKTGIKVGDSMSEGVVSLKPNDTIEKCASLMRDKKIGSLMIKENNELKGLITERDIVRKVVAKGVNPSQEKVEHYMTTNLSTITPDKDIFEALIKMRDDDVRHLPVVEGKKVVGVLTLKDVLKIQPQLFDLLIEKIDIENDKKRPIHNVKEKEGICEICGEYTEELVNKDNSLLCKNCI
jgi:signal-transduction protein with cAMP-binding, CBS, and nucleotidyltransferase domain